MKWACFAPAAFLVVWTFPFLFASFPQNHFHLIWITFWPHSLKDEWNCLHSYNQGKVHYSEKMGDSTVQYFPGSWWCINVVERNCTHICKWPANPSCQFWLSHLYTDQSNSAHCMEDEEITSGQRNREIIKPSVFWLIAELDVFTIWGGKRFGCAQEMMKKHRR